MSRRVRWSPAGDAATRLDRRDREHKVGGVTATESDPGDLVLPFATHQVRLRMAASATGTGDTAADPHWGRVWPAALALADALLARRLGLTDGPALEIGCGTGLAGLALALTGREVCASDRVAAALDLVRRNAVLNHVDTRVSTVVLDWNTPPTARWPLILGADVLYLPESPRAVARFLDAALSDDGLALISDPDRPTARHFHLVAQEAGLAVEMQTLPVPFVDTHGPVTALRVPLRTLTVTLFLLRRRRHGAVRGPDAG